MARSTSDKFNTLLQVYEAEKALLAAADAEEADVAPTEDDKSPLYSCPKSEVFKRNTVGKNGDAMWFYIQAAGIYFSLTTIGFLLTLFLCEKGDSVETETIGTMLFNTTANTTNTTYLPGACAKYAVTAKVVYTPSALLMVIMFGLLVPTQIAKADELKRNVLIHYDNVYLVRRILRIAQYYSLEDKTIKKCIARARIDTEAANPPAAAPSAAKPWFCGRGACSSSDEPLDIEGAACEGGEGAGGEGEACEGVLDDKSDERWRIVQNTLQEYKVAEEKAARKEAARKHQLDIDEYHQRIMDAYADVTCDAINLAAIICRRQFLKHEIWSTLRNRRNAWHMREWCTSNGRKLGDQEKDEDMVERQLDFLEAIYVEVHRLAYGNNNPAAHGSPLNGNTALSLILDVTAVGQSTFDTRSMLYFFSAVTAICGFSQELDDDDTLDPVIAIVHILAIYVMIVLPYSFLSPFVFRKDVFKPREPIVYEEDKMHNDTTSRAELQRTLQRGDRYPQNKKGANLRRIRTAPAAPESTAHRQQAPLTPFFHKTTRIPSNLFQPPSYHAPSYHAIPFQL